MGVPRPGGFVRYCEHLISGPDTYCVIISLLVDAAPAYGTGVPSVVQNFLPAGTIRLHFGQRRSGRGATGITLAPSVIRVPQAVQKLLPAGTALPQLGLGQRRSTGATGGLTRLPQDGQREAPGGILTPHCGQATLDGWTVAGPCPVLTTVTDVGLPAGSYA